MWRAQPGADVFPTGAALSRYTEGRMGLAFRSSLSKCKVTYVFGEIFNNVGLRSKHRLPCCGLPPLLKAPGTFKRTRREELND